MPTAFVTGANSFLGATLVRQLLDDGWQVRGLLRADSNDILLRDLTLERVTGDLLQPQTYAAALKNCDALFHIAALYTHDPAQLPHMQAVNVEGTRHILTAALEAGVPRLLHTSTIGTLGQPNDGNLAHEETPFNLPNPSAYVRSKLAGEQIANELAQAGGHIVIVHPTAMLGPGDWRPTNSGRLVLNVLAGRIPPYPAGGINWCPVEDVGSGLIRAVERGQKGRHYLLGHQSGNLDLNAFLDLISQAADQPRPQPPARGLKSRLKAVWLNRFSAPDPPAPSGASPDRLTCDPARAVTELGLPQSDLLAAARAEARWYRQNGYYKI